MGAVITRQRAAVLVKRIMGVMADELERQASDLRVKAENMRNEADASAKGD